MLSLADVPFPTPERWTAGLLDGTRGTLVHAKRERRVWRVEEGDLTFFAKRGTGSKVREVAREAEIHEALRLSGLPVVPLLGAGRADDGFWLITAGAPGVTLGAAVDTAIDARDDAAVRGSLGRAAAALAALHVDGYRWPDATASHFFVDPATPAPGGVTLIDVARAEKPRGGVTGAHRAEDLASLLFSVPLAVGRIARARIVRDVLGRGDAARPLLRRLHRELRARARRTRWRHGHAEAAPEVVAALAALRGDAEIAVRAGLFDALMSTERVERVRTLPDRENRRFAAPRGRTYFAKWYPAAESGFSPAMQEVRGALLLARAGVPTCRVVAYAEDLEQGSLVVTRGCEGVPLDDLLRDGTTPGERRTLAHEAGVLYGRLRAARLRHRDAYPCHVFADRDTDRFGLRFIDLTRSGRAPAPRERWHVKDVAQLWHGLPAGSVSATDAVRFLRAYFAIPRLDARAKRFAARVLRKERRISARQERRARAAR